MVVSSSSINMERLKDQNVELCRFIVVINTCVSIYVRKRRLLSVLNLTKYKIKKNEEIKVKKNTNIVSA